MADSFILSSDNRFQQSHLWELVTMTETYFSFLNGNTVLDVFLQVEEHVVVFLKKDLELGSWLIYQIKLNQLATLI